MTVIIDGEEYLTAGEAAEYLGVSGTTFVKYQEEYNLKFKTRLGMGNRKFFRKKDLEPLLQFREGGEAQNGHKA